jgi:hypothetical protein
VESGRVGSGGAGEEGKSGGRQRDREGRREGGQYVGINIRFFSRILRLVVCHSLPPFLPPFLSPYLLFDIGPFLLPGASTAGVRRRAPSVGAGEVVVLI